MVCEILHNKIPCENCTTTTHFAEVVSFDINYVQKYILALRIPYLSSNRKDHTLEAKTAQLAELVAPETTELRFHYLKHEWHACVALHDRPCEKKTPRRIQTPQRLDENHIVISSPTLKIARIMMYGEGDKHWGWLLMNAYRRGDS